MPPASPFAPGIGDAGIALDEEGQPRLVHRLPDAGQATGEPVALDGRHGDAEALRRAPATSSTATAQPNRPSGAAAIARADDGEVAASSWSATAITSR